MILCEKPLAMNAAEGRGDGRGGREGQACRTWSGTTTAACRPSRFAKQLIDEGKLGRIFHYRANFLQDWTISADLPQGGAGPVAARRRRRPAAASPATCSPTASTPPSGSTAASRSVTAMTETFIKERKHNLTGKVEKVGIDDACAFLCRFDNGSLGLVRIDPLRPRPQGALHLRDQRRERLDQVGPARPAPPAILRPPRRGHRSAAGGRSTSPTATIPTWATGGCRACRSATSTRFVHQVADFLDGLGHRVPRRLVEASPSGPSSSQPPARRICSGTQWPDANGGSSHSRPTTRRATGRRVAPRLDLRLDRAEPLAQRLDEVDRRVLGLGHGADRADRVEDALDRGRLEGHDGDVGVDRPGDVVDLAVADRADAAQLLGQDQVGLGGGERLLVERVQRRAAVDGRGDSRWMSRDDGVARSWTLRVMTGLAARPPAGSRTRG